MRISKLDITTRIDGGIRNIENRIKRTGWNILRAGYVTALEREIPVAYLAQNGPISIPILTQGDPVIRRGTVKFRKEQSGWPITPVIGDGKQVFQAVCELVPKREAPAVGSKASSTAGYF